MVGKEEGKLHHPKGGANFTQVLSFRPTPKMAVACMNGMHHYISLIFLSLTPPYVLQEVDLI